MLQFCVVLLCFLSTTDVEGIRQLKSIDDPVTSAVSSVATPINRTVDNSTSTVSVNNLVIPENATGNSSVMNTTSEPTEKTGAAPKLAKNDHDQQSPSSGVFSKTPKGAALRGLYVFVGLSAVVMLYIVVKLVRLRRKKMRIRKYGLIANVDDVEMTPLEADDDDEDTTLFDAHNHIGR